MKQYFIDTSGSMMPDMILAALNIIGKEYIRNQYDSRNAPGSIHFLDFLQFKNDLDLKTFVRNSCSESGDECILYTDGFISETEKTVFDDIVVIK